MKQSQNKKVRFIRNANLTICKRSPAARYFHGPMVRLKAFVTIALLTQVLENSSILLKNNMEIPATSKWSHW